MPDSKGSAVKIGDVIIDEQTGEILECPEGIGDRMEWLTHLAVEAKDQEKTWASAGGMYRQAIGKLLDEAGQKRIATEYGIPGWRARLDRRAKPDNLPELIKEHELSEGQVNAVFTTARELDVGRLDILVKQGVIPAPVARGLTTEKESSWVQIDVKRKAAPEVERIER